jgi:phage terminase small subunit
MPRLKNKQQERFAKNYVTNGFNGAKAARSAGYSVKAAKEAGSRLLTYPLVATRVLEIEAGVDVLLDMSLEETVAEINKLSQFNPQDLYDDNGHLIPIHELHEDVAVNIQEVTDTGYKAGKDKMQALDKQLRIHNAYEDHESAGGGVINIYLDETDLKL